MDKIIEIINSLMKESLGSLIGVSLGLLSVIMTIYFYIKSQKVKKPYCIITNKAIIGNSISKIEKLVIKYDGNEINNLSITTLIFWNAGRETINRNDVPENAPFQILAENNTKIYQVMERFSKREANAFNYSLSSDSKIINLSFDFFDRNDGFILDIVHSGENTNDLNIQATFKGAEPLVKRTSLSFHNLPKPINELMSSDFRIFLSLILIFLIPLFAIDNIFKFTLLSQQITNYQDYITAIILIPAAWYAAYYLLKTRIPKGFVFFD